MEKMGSGEKSKKAGLTPKAVLLGASMILPNVVGNTTPTENTFKEKDGMKIESIVNKVQEINPENTVVYSPTDSVSKQSEEVKNDEVVNIESKPTENTPENINESVTTAPSATVVIPEKEIKKVEVTAPAIVELNNQTFTEHVKNLLNPMMGKSKLEDIRITGSGDVLTVKADITGSGFDIGFLGSFKSDNGELVMKDHSIDANWLIRGKAEKKLTQKMKMVLNELKVYLENNYKSTHPSGIDHLAIEGGNLKIIFNKI